METDSHDSVGVIECLFNSIPVVNVDVEVENAWVDFEELDDADDDVIDVAEAASLSFTCMVKTAHPVDSNVSFSR